MTIRNLDYLFAPRSVVLIGASGEEGKVGHVIARNLLESGFEGPVHFVNPGRDRVLEQKVWPSVSELPDPPDLGVIATPPQTVPGIIDELGRTGARAAIVVTAGFGEGGEDGRELEQRMLDAARPHLLRVLGPNCLGAIVPGHGLNASFAHLRPEPGEIAFVTQSGAVVTSVIDWAQARGIGFSHLVSLGGAADIDFGDMLDYLANQRDTSAVLLYVEAITHARKFMSAARAAARMKPVIVVKAGRFEASAKAAASHTGALAGSDDVYDAAFRRAGLLRVGELSELFGATEILSRVQRVPGDRLCIVSNGGGVGVMATDELIRLGGTLAELSDESREALDEVLPATWSRGNPVDVIGDADGERYSRALDVVLKDPGVDATLVLNCPTAVISGRDVAERVADTWEQHERPLILTSFVGEVSAGEPREICSQAGIPTFSTPERAVKGFMHLVNYDRNQRALMETPPSVPRRFTQDTAKAREIIDAALAEGREWLPEAEAKALLGAYDIPVVDARSARSPEEAAAMAAGIDGPVVLKIQSPDIQHKSDVDGVALDLEGESAVLEAARNMLQRVKSRKPDARIEGFVVEPMISRPDAFELLVGTTEDEQFGPVILFGHGGVAAETIDDTAIGLPPMNMRLAKGMMERTRVWRLLRGYRNRESADLEAIGTVILQVAQLVTDFAEIAELDINPLVADADGVIALDARVRLQREERNAQDRLAILPYPKSLEEELESDGQTLLLRPIMPEDEPSLHRVFRTMNDEELRLRFHAPIKVLTHMMAARFTQLDYDREMAFVLTEPGIPGKTPIYGVARLFADPDRDHADFAIIVHHDMTGRGLGYHMMERLIDYARSVGIRELGGDVLNENRRMLKIAEELGFRITPKLDERGMKRVTLEL
ncbi:bifunctional acetate--CoA ligase family protein/GNAT family N-acetyltransferase [Lentisalinibacter salinarum]|uniref:bifunctional acetate--CoA ligase family protein/GNAT family N-acetyltransferase n=1 Tax=Lentisalinibacter salinarum TaxID=2992239 RepID=UPI003867E17E